MKEREEQAYQEDKYRMIIFGGTGDLTRRKLLPALYNLTVQGLLPKDFSVVPIGRRHEDGHAYRSDARQAAEEYSRFDIEQEHWEYLAERIDYQRFDFRDDEGYEKLEQILAGYQGKRIFYLAVAPEFFGLIVDKLKNHGLLDRKKNRTRLVIEKPFGRDLESARRLNERIRQVFPEDNIYRIDHYLGKEMLQNILVIRFANTFLEPVWNNRYIDNVQIISSEPGGVGLRGSYYEKAGALKDMVQNHMIQLLTLTAMEPPGDMETESIRNEKVKVLKSLDEMGPEEITAKTVRGQYGPGEIDGQQVMGYRQEKRTHPESGTETFVALKLEINNLRWSGVPFYIKTGKRLPRKSTQVIIEFKSRFHPSYLSGFPQLDSNLLVIRVQPKEGVFFQFNAKQPGTRQKIVPVQMDFCQNCQIGINSPEAYERLIYDILRGDQTLFTRWDEVEYAWRYIDRIAEAWSKDSPGFPNYPAGSSGPEAAGQMLNQDGREWWELDSDCQQIIR